MIAGRRRAVNRGGAELLLLRGAMARGERGLGRARDGDPERESYSPHHAPVKRGRRRPPDEPSTLPPEVNNHDCYFWFHFPDLT